MHLQHWFCQKYFFRITYNRILHRKQYSPSVFDFFFYQSYLQSWEILRTFQGLGHCDFLNFESVRTSRLVSGRKLIDLTNKKASRVEQSSYMETFMLRNLYKHYFLNSFFVWLFLKKRIIIFSNFNTFAL